jgi:hypothetical protein
MRRAVVLACLLIVVSGCAGRREVERLFGERENLALVSSTSRVAAFRVAAAPASTGKGPVALNVDQLRRLRAILNDPNTYWFGVAKSCRFNPDILIQFAADNGRVVAVTFCFSCDEVRIEAEGVQTGIEDTDPQRPALLRLARELFPDDAYLQHLIAN